jgi:transcription termination/antitermination protein NusG
MISEGEEIEEEFSADEELEAPASVSEVGAEPAKAEDKDGKRPTLPKLDPEREKLPWYVVHTYSGFEMRVKATLEERVRTRAMSHRFGHIIVPQETVVELVRGQKKTSTKKFFPGYILVQVDLDDETWHLIKDTPKVTGFVGDPRNPSPLSEAEVKALLQQMEGGAHRPRPKVQFEQGDAVKVIDGPFAEFNGTVDEVKADKGKLRVLISIFGRNTPVELDFVQVEKV